MVIVLDTNDCADTASYVIYPTYGIGCRTPLFKNALCNGGADGAIDANPSGGTPSLRIFMGRMAKLRR